MVEKDSESFYAKYLRLSLPFLILIFLSMQVFALTTNDSNYSSGVYNGDFEYGTGINTTSGWVMDRNTGIYFTRKSGDVNISFDVTEKYSGNQSLKMHFADLSYAYITFGFDQDYGTTTAIDPMKFNGVGQIKPNTKYKISYIIKAKDSNGSCYGQFIEYNSSFTRVAVSTTPLISGTNVWTNVSLIITSNSSSKYGVVAMRNSSNVTAGTCWFDDVRLEEVGSVNLSGQLQGRPSIVVTGVSDFDAIDQADTNNSGVSGFGNGLDYGLSQCFLPTQNSFNGVTLQRAGSVGTPTGDLIISLRDINQVSGLPTGDPLISSTLTAVQWEAINTYTNFKIELPYILDANGTNKYCWDINSTTQDANNFFRLARSTGTTYSGGIGGVFDGNIWKSSSFDRYFLTHFEKQSSAFDLNVCSSGDSVCEFKTYDISDLNDGETYTISPSDAPLFYSGDNNVYFMMHSDSDYNNKTPSMMAKLQYTFDKPTTLLTNTPSTEDNKRIITLTCQNAVTGNCNNTYYSTDGVNYATYTTPLTLTLGTTTLRYYSTADNNNIETINTTNITIPAQGGTTTCSLISIIPLLIVLVSIMLILGGGAMMTDQAPAAIIQIVLLMVTILITVYVLITSTCFL